MKAKFEFDHALDIALKVLDVINQFVKVGGNGRGQLVVNRVLDKDCCAFEFAHDLKDLL